METSPPEGEAPLAWPSEQLLAAFGTVVEGAALDAPDLTGSIALVVPSTAGRPRRSRSAGSPSSPSSDSAHGTLEVKGGHVVGWKPGEVAADALATLTLPAPDARSLLAGTEEPSVLFMQGRLKVDGDMAAVLAVLRATTTDGYGRGRATLAGSTAG